MTATSLVSLAGIHRYPVKSCGGEDLLRAVVEPWGLEGDRRWMLVDDDGEAVTAREAHDLLLVRTETIPTGLRLRADGRPVLDVGVPDAGVRRPVRLWGSHVQAVAVDPGADAWFSELLGRRAQLVWLDDPMQRPCDPRFGEPQDRVSLADGYPLLLATQESLAALDDEVLSRSAHDREPLAMRRFRPNLVVRGAPAWAEDDWRRVRVGEATFRAVKGCARCVITTLDPDTAERGKEPIASLARLRRFDGSTWFGVNLVPDLPGTVVAVGDDVEVLEAAPPGGGPVRPHRASR